MDKNIKEGSENSKFEIEQKEKIESKKRNNILRNFLIIVSILFVGFIIGSMIISSQNTFDYRGVKFQIVKEIAPYKTNLLLNQRSSITGAVTQIPYYYYIRTDPRELDKIPFEGKLVLMDNMIVNSTEDFNCGGQGILGMTNLARLLQSTGINVIKNKTADCDPYGQYLFLNLEPGNETKIVEVWPSCYKMYINNCEVLKATERFMTETLVELNKIKAAKLNQSKSN
jgi:hypothetical protein